MEDFIRSIPKAELHLHIEGSLEPELLFELAKRNGVALAFPTVEDLRRAYDFSDLQSFLDIYYQGASVLLTEADFFDLTRAYLKRAKADGVRHVEIFYDPQTHTERGLAFETSLNGIYDALTWGQAELDISFRLIPNILRHLSEGSALETLEAALPFRDKIDGFGLDSSEVGNPPEKFARVFEKVRDEGFHVVAHAGEEGPPAYIWQALELLQVERVDHGVRALEDAELVKTLSEKRIPLTVCPLSNVKLRVFDTLEDHNLKTLMEAGLLVTINSDDPAYFGGYLGDNFIETAKALDLSQDNIIELARNSFEASFLDEEQRASYLGELERFTTA